MTAAFCDAGLQAVASEQRSALSPSAPTVTSEVMLSLGPGK